MITHEEDAAMPGREAAIDLVNRWFAFANAHDVEGIVSLLAEEATWQDSGVPMLHKGNEAIAKNLRHAFGAFPDWRFKYRIRLADEHTVAVEIDNTATWTQPYLGQQPSGRTAAFPEAGFFETTNGKIHAYRGYLDMHEWANQIGLKLPF
ncbi:MAG: nuclear transport factor 2 family protein [Chloroflexi bacterium]|nr:nuclear transport factor 2 family protein [Chloroflexota bacterium]